MTGTRSPDEELLYTFNDPDRNQAGGLARWRSQQAFHYIPCSVGRLYDSHNVALQPVLPKVISKLLPIIVPISSSRKETSFRHAVWMRPVHQVVPDLSFFDKRP